MSTLARHTLQTVTYIKNFIKDRHVASVTPSSPFLIKRVCRRMDVGTERRVVVEYGPGTGVFSRYILERMGPDDRLLMIETNQAFIEKLQPLVRDPRAEVFHESAEHVAGILEAAGESAADYVLSGIPFSFFSDAERHSLIRQTRDALKVGGEFLVYQHYNHMEEPLRQHFERVDTDFELLNLPPIHIQFARKMSAASQIA